MTDKILKENGEVMYQSTLRGFTPAKMENPVHIDAQRRFDEAINRNLGPKCASSDFDKSHTTPEFMMDYQGCPKHLKSKSNQLLK